MQAAERGIGLTAGSLAAGASGGPAGSSAASSNVRRGVALLRQEKAEAYSQFKRQLQVRDVLCRRL
jgi:hypothetical protein